MKFRIRGSRRPNDEEKSPDPEQAWKILELINSWIRHSDAKAGVTLAFVGALAAILYNLVSDFSSRTAIFDVLVIIACALLTIAGVLCGATLVPRTEIDTDESSAPNLLFFASIHERYSGKRDEYRKDLAFLTTDHERLHAEISDQVHANANIASVKSRHAKRAIGATLTAGAVIALIAGIIGAVNA